MFLFCNKHAGKCLKFLSIRPCKSVSWRTRVQFAPIPTTSALRPPLRRRLREGGRSRPGSRGRSWPLQGQTTFAGIFWLVLFRGTCFPIFNCAGAEYFFLFSTLLMFPRKKGNNFVNFFGENTLMVCCLPG